MNYLTGLAINEKSAVQTVLLVKDEAGKTIPELILKAAQIVLPDR